MNRSTINKEANSSILSSSSSSPPTNGVSRISISGPNATAAGNTSTTGSTNGGGGGGGGSSGGGGGAATIGSSSLMNGNGELMFRRSPVSSQLSHLHQSYYTLGTPSITTSYNSEEISDNIHSSLFDDETGNVNDSLCVKVEQLQRQVELLTESQASQDDRYKRTRQENDDLLNRIHLLEDQLREIEITSENRSREEEKRFKETMAKQMKMKSQECEQHLQTNYQLQQEIIALQKDLIKSETMIRALKSEKEVLEADLSEKTSELITMDEEVHKLKLLVKHMKDEESVKSNLINILNEELEENSQHRSQSEQQGQLLSSSSHHHHQINHHHNNNSNNPQTSSPKQRSTSSRRSSITSGFGDEFSSSQAINSKTLKDLDVLEANLAKLREENKRLKEMNEELQAQLLNVQLEEGRSLIQEGTKSYSLADELGDIDVHKLMEALKDQQEDNARLRRYIDEILLKIVENNPEILDKTI